MKVFWADRFLDTLREKVGFSLIELMVVIGIVSVLAALLLPALGAAKLRGHQVSCTNNLKQLALAHTLYDDDYKTEIANLDGLGLTNPWENLYAGYYGSNQSLLFCPDATTLLRGLPTLNYPGYEVYGTADTAWYMVGSILSNDVPIYFTNQGSYALNAWLYNPFGVLQGTNYPFFRRPSAVRCASLTPVFADCIADDVSPYSNDLPATNSYLGGFFHPIGIRSMSFDMITIARHGSRASPAAPRNVSIAQRLPGAINVSFVDGHVEKTPLDNLWNYYWSDGWQVPHPRPGL
jgi:prepilin-type N-terminal cleavage/methylation domain-containing protein/prepilin-type processing-associated H-X9-DG protein